jgi:hypothetical protein
MLGRPGIPAAKMRQKAQFFAFGTGWHTIRLMISQLES